MRVLHLVRWCADHAVCAAFGHRPMVTAVNGGRYRITCSVCHSSTWEGGRL